MARMDVDALRLTDTLQREQQGSPRSIRLLALARQQQRLAGRKTILFFSEGLQITPRLEHVLPTAVSEANRANVSIYAVDARGLTDAEPAQRPRGRRSRRAAAARAAPDAERGVGAGRRQDEVLVAGDRRGEPAHRHAGDARRPGREHRRRS